MGEFEAIDRIRALFPAAPSGQVWIGDDAAVVVGGLLVATDAIAAGLDMPADAPLADLGWKAVAINVSDIAAMGGRPTHLLVTVMGPAGVDVDALYEGIAEASRTWACPVVGGDLGTATDLVVSVTALGTTDGRAPVLRSGATVGDALYVSGPLGGAAASGWRTRPQPPVTFAVAAATAGATSMIDVSDGLGADLGHVLDASRVGAVLENVPVAVGATEAQAMGGGDDYEIVFTLGADRDPPAGAIRIGSIVADEAVRPPASGWQHDIR